MRPALRDRALLFGAALAGLAGSVALVVNAYRGNGFLGLPLDDAWIHLTFARTLAEHGTFAYFPGGPATSGSTSPLYTLILAAGFLLTSHEKILSYAVDLTFQAAFLAALGAWAREKLGSVWAAAAVVLIIGLDGRIAILSVSGMETSLFLAAIAAAYLARAKGRPALCAAACGTAVWVRPEGMILAGVLGIDAALERVWDRDGRDVLRPVRPVVVFLVLLAAYFGWNLAIGGRLLPNTFAAKTAYYAPASRTGFLAGDVLGLFGEGGWLALAPFVVAAFAREGLALVRRHRSPLRAEAGWAIALPLAFVVVLPFAHRFSRYLVPVLPAAAILGVAAARDAVEFLARRGAGRLLRATAYGVLALLVAAPHARAAWEAADTYGFYCAYHAARHERCGRWLAAHTPADAVVATHDIGAIAFYSRRRIVDTAGLIDPEVVPHLHSPDRERFLASLFARRGVTYLAVLRNWLEVSNVEPLFVADPEPEILEVYPWIPGWTHLMPEAASRLEEAAAERLLRGDGAGALELVGRSIAIDPDSARTHLLQAKVFASVRRLAEAEGAYRRAIELQPDSPEARFGLATILAATGRRDEARTLVEALRAEGRSLPRLDAFHRALE
jgi:arabinofuranosyltransferase